MVVEREVVQHPYWVNFLPLGAGQFQNGHRRKGWALFGAQISLAAVSAGTYIGGYLAYSGQSLTSEEYDRARTLSVVQIVSAGLCAATVAYGIIDALVYHEPRTVKERRYRRAPETPAGAGGGKARDEGTAVFVIPSLGADGRSAGLGLGFAF